MRGGVGTGSGFAVLRLLARPTQPGPVDTSRKAQRLQHPTILASEDAGAAATLLTRIRNETPRDASLFRRRVQVERERGRRRACFIPILLVALCLRLLAIVRVHAAERTGDRQAVTRPQCVNLQHRRSVCGHSIRFALVAFEILDDFVRQHRRALAAHQRRAVGRPAVSQGARQHRHRRLWLLVGIRNHRDGVEAERVGEDERSSAGIR